jgi:hypothetical protein
MPQDQTNGRSLKLNYHPLRDLFEEIRIQCLLAGGSLDQNHHDRAGIWQRRRRDRKVAGGSFGMEIVGS